MLACCSDSKIHQGELVVDVFVSFTQCVLLVVFCGLTTVDMVAFTGQTLVSLYPKLSVQQLILPTATFNAKYNAHHSTVDSSEVQVELDVIGTQLLSSNTDWLSHCGLECPSLVRSFSKQLGLFYITNHKTDLVLAGWAKSESQWLLGWQCFNQICC